MIPSHLAAIQITQYTIYIIIKQDFNFNIIYMSNRALFEKELKNKLSLKSSGHTTEETVLIKAFKYFDLDNSGKN